MFPFSPRMAHADALDAACAVAAAPGVPLRQSQGEPRRSAVGGPSKGSTWTPHSFVAGCIAGALSQLAGHPFDTFKVHVQTQLAEPLSLRVLFRGCGPPVLSTGFCAAFALGTYDNLRRWLHVRCGFGAEQPTPMVLHVAASAGSGALTAFLTCPVQRIKITQQVHSGSLAHTVATALRTRSLYRDLGVTMAFQVIGRIVYYPSYVYIKGLLGDRPGQPQLSMPLAIAAGGAANTVSWMVIYPIDVVQTMRMSDRSAASAVQTARALVAEGGVRRLYGGLMPTLLRGFCIGGIQLPLFDLSLAALERWSTP